ncbi:aminotransferase class I/II-fold pyridoxal phosphate-dependent enzyme [Alkalibacter rhizosphaerae]|uniref:Aminotransferase class I/II-fold pyridoxal phosphate-dependent enzyme n=1 Tax=Alkalibacter rhizosphaerae TaxID=2815577 RepID=A0A975AGP5_9FIRM|nr:aminotransferase class I/II-fold pyridoxal phosphate-dependent enzyme [Alkalibacter rhizosphaerae]QSX07597.1 aminotransferase class I/II-fold pyridoxal phosphate-dependent enzyme [Alkalibacter rhizosphaerae]
MDRKLIENIQKKRDHVKFHMPGHKGRAFFPYHGEAWDITEIPGTDNLNDPREEILALEQDIARIYGSLESRIVVNGATSALMAAIMATFRPGQQVLIPRNAHKSVYSAFIYGRISPVYISPDMGGALGYPVGITPKAVKKAMDEAPDAKGLVITYPSYYGTCDDLEAIGALCRQRSMILLVDEAHGAHFHFGKNMPVSALDAGGDVVVHSTHKTLSSLTPGALLHINSRRVDPEAIRRHLSMLQTSSPSYPILISVAQAVGWMERYGGAKLELLEEMYREVRQELKTSPFPMVRDRWAMETKNWDPLKLWFCSGNRKELGRILSQSYGIDLEWEDGRTGLAMAGVGSIREDYIRLLETLKSIGRELPEETGMGRGEALSYPKPGKKVMELYEEAPWEQVSLSQAAGRISADFITPYPPGIPWFARERSLEPKRWSI